MACAWTPSQCLYSTKIENVSSIILRNNCSQSHSDALWTQQSPSTNIDLVDGIYIWNMVLADEHMYYSDHFIQSLVSLILRLCFALNILNWRLSIGATGRYFGRISVTRKVGLERLHGCWIFLLKLVLFIFLSRWVVYWHVGVLAHPDSNRVLHPGLNYSNLKHPTTIRHTWWYLQPYERPTGRECLQNCCSQFLLMSAEHSYSLHCPLYGQSNRMYMKIYSIRVYSQQW